MKHASPNPPTSNRPLLTVSRLKYLKKLVTADRDECNKTLARYEPDLVRRSMHRTQYEALLKQRNMAAWLLLEIDAELSATIPAKDLQES